MKKVFNWLGTIIISCICLFLVFLIVFATIMKHNQNYDAWLALWGMFAVVLVVFLPFISLIWYKTLGILLPIKQDKVMLINHFIQELHSRASAGKVHRTIKFFLTFQFNDGTRKTFCVNTSMYGSDMFFNILQNEQGTLQYKEQGKHLYFVSFTPDSTGKTIS